MMKLSSAVDDAIRRLISLMVQRCVTQRGFQAWRKRCTARARDSARRLEEALLLICLF